MSGLEARSIVEDAVRRELFGPAPGSEPRGNPVDCVNGSIHFETLEASRGQFHDATTLQELLTQSDPLRRYGIGVLYNGGARRGSTMAAGSENADSDEADDLTWLPGLADTEEAPDGPPIEVKGTLRDDVADSDDFDLTDANTFKPSAMAVSFKCRVPAAGTLRLAVRGAHYDKISAHIPGLKQTRDWWLRRPFVLVGTVPGSVLLNDTHRLKIVPMTATAEPPPRIAPTTQVFSRPVPGDPDPELRLVTVAVVNQATGTGPSSALFQMGFDAAADEGLVIEPYPEVEQPDRDEEGQSIDLLYRKKRTYAIGHGCAANWGTGTEESVPWVRAEPLPAYEVVSLTPNVYLADGAGKRVAVTVSMEELAGETSVGRDQVEAVLRLYEEWISAREAEITDLPTRFQAAARRHMEHCREALSRMQTGWAMVGSDAIARRAFQLANQAMLYQQVRSRLPLREVRGRARRCPPSGRTSSRRGRPAGAGELARVPDRLHPGELARTR